MRVEYSKSIFDSAALSAACGLRLLIRTQKTHDHILSHVIKPVTTVTHLAPQLLICEAWAFLLTQTSSDSMTDYKSKFNFDEKTQWRIERQRRIERVAKRDADRQRAMMRQPFLEERLLTDDNPPNCTLAAFKEPRLRKCPFEFDQISCVDQITQHPDQDAGKCDGGLDGWNWKVDFEGVTGGPFVLKLVCPKIPSKTRIILMFGSEWC